jgi:hypothetical protein
MDRRMRTDFAQQIFGFGMCRLYIPEISSPMVSNGSHSIGHFPILGLLWCSRWMTSRPKNNRLINTEAKYCQT